MPFEWTPLKHEPPARTVPRGTLLRFRDQSWKDEVVVLMVCEWIGNPECRYSLVRMSGSKSGINPLQLLTDSAFDGSEVISVGWLTNNWIHWVWAASDPLTVEICYGPVSPDCFQ